MEALGVRGRASAAFVGRGAPVAAGTSPAAGGAGPQTSYQRRSPCSVRGRRARPSPNRGAVHERARVSVPAAIPSGFSHRMPGSVMLPMASHCGTAYVTVRRPSWRCRAARTRVPGSSAEGMVAPEPAWAVRRLQVRAHNCATAVLQPQDHERTPSPVVPKLQVPARGTPAGVPQGKDGSCRLLSASRESRTGPTRLRRCSGRFRLAPARPRSTSFAVRLAHVEHAVGSRSLGVTLTLSLTGNRRKSRMGNEMTA